MSELELLLSILTKANLATPAILAIIAAITNGRAVGLSDEEIEADSLAKALETREITATDMGDQP